MANNGEDTDSFSHSISPIAGLPSCISYITGLRNRLQNTPGSAILLVVNKVIPILIGPSKKPTMYDRGRGTWPGNLAGEPGRVCTVRHLQTRTRVRYLIGRILETIPEHVLITLIKGCVDN